MKDPVAPSVRVAHVIAEMYAFITNITFSHDDYLLENDLLKLNGILTQQRYFIKC